MKNIIKYIIYIGIIFLLTGCSQSEEQIDTDSRANEIEEKVETIEIETENTSVLEDVEIHEQSENVMDEAKEYINPDLSYDLATDVYNAMLYVNSEGRIVDENDMVIPYYTYITVLEDGSLSDGDCIIEGYSVAINGQIETYMVGEIEYREPIDIIRESANLASCTSEVIYEKPDWADEGWTNMEDDGSYFDEVVLEAWIDESGEPLADFLPEELRICINRHSSNAEAKIKNYHFIDGQRYSLDTLKRSTPGGVETYAMVLINITKQQDNEGNIYMIGYDYFTSMPIVIHGNFEGILNGDDILVFAAYTGLAADDTPNFSGIYIELINDRGLTY